MLILKKINAQKYAIKADSGEDRMKLLSSVYWKHSKRMEGYQFTPKYKSGVWNGKVNNFSPTNIKAGFLRETIEHLNNFQVPWKWEEDKIPDFLPFFTKDEFDSREFSEFCAKYIEAFAPKYKKKYGRDFEVRPYQIESAWKAIINKTGIILHATGSGKSFVIALILAFLFHKKVIGKAVIIVPRQSLTTQFRGDLIDFGFDAKKIGVILATQKQTTRPITIVMNQSLRTMEDTLEERDFLGAADFVICDEVHTAAAKTVAQSVLKFTNSKYFLGFTGTMPENELDADTVNAMFGYVLDEQKVSDLSGDILAEVTVGILTFNYGKKGKDSRKKRSESTRDWNEEVHFLQNDDTFRNPFIVNLLVTNYIKGVRTIVLVKNIEYGLKVYKNIRERATKNIYWIDGSMPLKERDEIIEACRASDDPYMIVTNFQIFSTGINIPNINLVAMIDAGKSKITVAQTIGRGVRKTQYKSKVSILDCSCDLKYGAKHGRKRKQLYQDEGFKVVEKIVSLEPVDDELQQKMNALKDTPCEKINS